MRTTPASIPGTLTVLVRTMWSYWRYTHRLLPIPGDARSAQERVAGRRVSGGSRQLVEIEPLHLVQILGPGHRSAVDRRFVGQRAVGNLGDDGSTFLHAQHAVVVTSPMCDGVQIPLVEDALDLCLASALDDEQHALLRFGQHDLVRRHARLALRHEGPRRSRRRRRRASPSRSSSRSAGRAHVLDADQRVGLHDLEARLEEQLLHEGVADLHGRPLLGDFSSNWPRPWSRRGCRRARSSRRRRRRRCRAHATPLTMSLRLRESEAEDVDERVAVVAGIEMTSRRPRWGRRSRCRSRRSGDDALQSSRWGSSSASNRSEFMTAIGRAPMVKMSRKMRDARRRALVRLDERAVVRFDLEDDDLAVADVSGSRLLARRASSMTSGAWGSGAS